MDGTEKAYLVKAFAEIDQAIVCRVEMMKKLSQDIGHELGCNQRGLLAWRSLSAPLGLVSFHSLIEEALTFQLKWFERWKSEKKQPPFPPEATSASQKLHSAYAVLMGRYGAENAQNKKAFFDYLCALDFI